MLGVEVGHKRDSRVQCRTMSDVERLGGPGITPRHASVDLLLPGMGPEECRSWESRLEASLRRCGCSESAALLLLALGYISFRPVLTLQVPPAPQIVQGLAFVLGAAAVGKVLGLGIARVRHRQLVQELAAVQDTV